MEEIFDDLICLDEEGESLESGTSENLPVINRQTRYCRMQSESCISYRRKHDSIARNRFPDDKQVSSRYCCHGKTSNMTRNDFHGNERYGKVKRIENTDELATDSSLLEVDSCEGDDTDCSQSEKDSCLDQSSKKGENRVNVNHTSLTSSAALPIYGDDEDWPYLSGDVDEEAVRLAASVDPDTIEEAKDGSRKDSRNKLNIAEKMTGKRDSQRYCNSNGSLHHSKTPNKLDDSKRPLRKFSSFTSSVRERRSVVHAYHETSHCMGNNKYPRYRRQSERRDSMERISFFMSSQNRRKSLHTRAGAPLLYSKKTYVPFPSTRRKEEIATNLLKKSSRINGVIIKRSYQFKTQSLGYGGKNKELNSENSVLRTECDKANSDNVRKKHLMLPPNNSAALSKTDEKKPFAAEKCTKAEILNESTQFLVGKIERKEIPKKNLRWVLTTEQFQSGGIKANSVKHKDWNEPETVAGHRVTTMTRHYHNIPRENPIKLRLPDLSVT